MPVACLAARLAFALSSEEEDVEASGGERQGWDMREFRVCLEDNLADTFGKGSRKDISP